MSAEEILVYLGAPEVTHTEYKLLHEGEIGEAIDFFATHGKGREEATSTRRLISEFYETSDARDIQHTTFNKMHKAILRAEGSVNAMNDSQKEISGIRTKLLSFETEIECLRREVKHKEMTKLLLHVLNKKEDIRRQRLVEISKLCENKRRCQKVDQLYAARSGLLVSVKVGERSPTPISSEHTHDMLATLQAYHRKMQRLEISAEDPTVTSGLKSLIAEKLAHTADSDPQVDMTLDKLKRIARLRAARTIKFKPPTVHPSGETAHFNSVTNRMKNKETGTQQISDELLSLFSSCSKALDGLAVFEESSIPLLHESLEQEKKAVQSYMDALNSSIQKRPSSTHGLESDSRRMPGYMRCDIENLKEVVQDLERQVCSNHEKLSFLQSSQLSPSVLYSEQNGDVLDLFASNTAKVESEIKKLLTRKVEKGTKLADVLISDTDRLLQEIELVVNGKLS
ncbi:hypothetical protein ABKN59_010139 [Abortiporus biennis]